MKYRSTLLAFALALQGQVLYAADPWDHAPSKWNAKDLQRILYNSPWAHGSSADFGILEKLAAQADNTPPDIPIGGENAGLPSGSPHSWDGGVGRPRGGPPTLPLTIRWESARPVREALQRGEQWDGHAAPAQYEKDYAISLIGIWPAAKLPEKAAPDSAVIPKVEDPEASQLKPGPDLGHMRQALLGQAHIKIAGKDPLTPEYVDLDPITGKITIYFPRHPLLTPDDGEAIFETRFGPMMLSQKFRLRDMVYEGKLAL